MINKINKIYVIDFIGILYSHLEPPILAVPRFWAVSPYLGGSRQTWPQAQGKWVILSALPRVFSPIFFRYADFQLFSGPALCVAVLTH